MLSGSPLAYVWAHIVEFSPNDEKEKNGCMYRHALPPGFVLRSQRKALEAAARGEQISIEEFIEVEVNPRLVSRRLASSHLMSPTAT